MPVDIGSTYNRRLEASVEEGATEAVFGLPHAAQGANVCSDLLIVVVADDWAIISLTMANFKHQ